MSIVDGSTDKAEQYRLRKLILFQQNRYNVMTNVSGVLWNKDTNKYLLRLPPTSKKGRISKEEKIERQENDSQKFYRMKNSLKKALFEIMLFLDVSPKKQIDDVFNKTTIEPIIQLLTTPRQIEIPDLDDPRNDPTDEGYIPNDPKARMTHISEDYSERQMELIGMLARVSLTKFKMVHDNLSSPDSKAIADALSTILSKQNRGRNQ